MLKRNQFVYIRVCDNVGNSVTVHRSWNVVTSGTSGGTTAPTPGCSCSGGCVCKITNNGKVIYSCSAHEACTRSCGITPSTTCGA